MNRGQLPRCCRETPALLDKLMVAIMPYLIVETALLVLLILFPDLVLVPLKLLTS